MHFCTVFICQPKGILLFTSCAVAHNPAFICRTICCIFRFFLIVITNKYDIMIGQRLNDQLFIQTFIDDFIINATPKKILCDDFTGWTFLWKKKWLLFIASALCFIYRSSHNTIPHDGFDRFDKTQFLNLDEIIKGSSAPDTSGPPHPFPVGNLQTVMFSCTVGVATDSDKLPRFIGAKIGQQIHPFRFSYDFRCNIWHCDHLLPRSDFSFWTRTLLFAVASRLSRRFSMWSVSLLSKSDSASRKGLGD